MAAELEQLAARLAALEDERAVLARLHAYGQAVDSADEDAFVDCFAPDGVCDVTAPGEGPVAQTVSGAAALGELIRGFARPPGSRHRHVVVAPVVRVAGDSATATSYFFVLRERDGAPIVWAFGRYLDDLRREADGQWRFSRRIAALDSVDAALPPLAAGNP